MNFYIAILFYLKIFLILDFFISLGLFYILVESESYYISKSVSAAPKIVLWGYAIHYFFNFLLPKFINNLKYPSIVLYMPYLFLALYIIYIGILILKNKEQKFSAPFIIHGLVSFILPFYFHFITAPTMPN